MAKQHIGTVALLVRDYDEAIAFYVEKLGFELVEDSDRGNGKRWVVVAPSGSNGTTNLLLAKAVGEEQLSHVGNQTGGRVGLFLFTDDFERDYARMRANGVKFLEEPRYESYGTVVVFEDLYGSKWDFMQRK